MINNRFSPIVMAGTLILAGGLAIAIWAWLDPVDATRLGTVASVFVALGTLELALVTYSQTRQLRAQTLETQHANLRPLLVPDGLLPKDDMWNQAEFQLPIRNVGAGVATNIWGVLLPPEEDRKDLPPQFYLRMPNPVAASQTVIAIFHIGGTKLGYTHTIEGYSFCVPRKHAPPSSLKYIWSVEDPRLARLTLTYHDVFGIKHASIFDMASSGAWVAEAILPNIPMDIEDIDNEKRMS